MNTVVYMILIKKKLYNSHGNLLFYDTSLSGPNSTDNSIGVHIAKKE